MSPRPSYATLLPFLALVAAAAFFGAQFEPGAWYEQLTKAPWTPPNWLFAPVWSLLYLGIAIAGWRVWRVGGAGKALVVWSAQLVLNALWSWLFFGRHMLGWALLDITVLLALILVFIAVAARVDRMASWLFMPYAVWVLYATTLNDYAWAHNPPAGG